MSKTLKRIFVIVFPLFLASCLTTKQFEARMTSAELMIRVCQQNIIALAQANKIEIPDFSDPRDTIILALIFAQREQPTFRECNAVALAAIESDGRVRAAVINGTVGVATMGIGVAGLVSVADSFADLGAAKGNSSITNSRVLDAGGGAITGSSASGENLFIGGTTAVDNSNALGGIQPRQALTRGNNNSAPSQSGSDAPIDLKPGDGNTILPVEP